MLHVNRLLPTLRGVSSTQAHLVPRVGERWLRASDATSLAGYTGCEPWTRTTPYTSQHFRFWGLPKAATITINIEADTFVVLDKASELSVAPLRHTAPPIAANIANMPHRSTPTACSTFRTYHIHCLMLTILLLPSPPPPTGGAKRAVLARKQAPVHSAFHRTDRVCNW
jgi:hypothetical protein